MKDNIKDHEERLGQAGKKIADHEGQLEHHT